VAPELAPPPDETAEQKAARMQRVIGSRVPDVRFLLDHLLHADLAISVDPARIGIVGHSFGGWTALAMHEVEPAIRAVVALAPGGAAMRRERGPEGQRAWLPLVGPEEGANIGEGKLCLTNTGLLMEARQENWLAIPGTGISPFKTKCRSWMFLGVESV
jgi:pimeloyl-ACP methyl ester carboxylesterase